MTRELALAFWFLGGMVCACLAQSTPATGTIAEVRPHHGTPTLYINNQPTFPVAMIPIGDFPTEVCRDFSRAGVNLFSHIIWNWRSITPGSNQPLSEPNRWWLGPGKYDFDKVDRRLKAILNANPEAYIFPRVKLNPPDWWLEANPDEITRYADGTPGPQHSMASRAWEETYERMLRDLIGHIETSDYADRIVGYHLAGGKSSEWFWWGFDKDWIDYSPAARQRFREWLRDHYRGEVAGLRKVWNDAEVTFETAEPPGAALREATEYGVFRDPEVARPAIDYVRFLSDITAHNIIRSCQIVKEITDGRKITGVLYGYMLHFAHCRYLVANEGMCGLEQVLASPYVDFLSSPPQYEQRRGGHPGLFQSGYFGSYRLHNKLFWQEADDRTHLAVDPVHYRSADMSETLGLLDRQIGYALAQMNGLWWFTLAGNETFRDEQIMQRVATISRVAEQAVERRGSRRHDVALFADEHIYARMQFGPTALMNPLVTDMRRMLSRSGVPHDFYLLSDIAHPGLPDYKMYVFLNSFQVSDDLRAAIAAKVRRNQSTAVWFYAPGFIGGDGTFNEQAMTELTGIRIGHVRQPVPLALKVTRLDHALTAGLRELNVKGTKEPVDPVFYAEDPAATVLGMLETIDRPGLAVREFEAFKSIYFAGPTMTPELFRNLARYAGCHVYSETNDVFDANSRYLMLHTAIPGPKRIVLPAAADVRNVITGEQIGRNVAAIELTAEQPGETHLFELILP